MNMKGVGRLINLSIIFKKKTLKKLHKEFEKK